MSPAFEQLLRGQCAAPIAAEVALLVAAAREKFGNAVVAVLFYGSCRRAGDASVDLGDGISNGIGNGIADLYVIVDDRRSVERGWRAWLGGWLPPNVYFLSATPQSVAPSATAPRAKVGVFTFAELERGSRALQPYVWGRLAQPVSLVYAKDEAAQQRVLNVLAACVSTFLDNALPLAAGRAVADAWRVGLAASYTTELRAERAGRATDIVGDDADYYEALTFAARPDHLLRGTDGHWRVDPTMPLAGRARLWRWRALSGKCWSVLRLLKGLYTFDGGFDYIAWKLSRHAGRPIEIPERVRRWPWLFVWSLMLRLYREGVFR